MPHFQITYTIEARNISEVLGILAFPEGEDNPNKIDHIYVNEVQG